MMDMLSNITTNLYDIKGLVSGGIIKLIGAIIILLIGIVISKFISKLSKKLLSKLKLDVIFKKSLRIDVPIEDFISTIIKYIFYLIFIIIALQNIGLTTFILNVILIAILVILIIFILLAMKDLIPNLSAGILLHHRKFLKVGDEIRVKDINGKILEITLTEVKLETKNKDVVVIPNSVLIKNEVVRKKWY